MEGGHHPELHLTDSRTINLVLSTAAVKGLTIQDFNLAKQIDESNVLYSSKWLKGNPSMIKAVLQTEDENASGFCPLLLRTPLPLADINNPGSKLMSGICQLAEQGTKGGFPGMQGKHEWPEQLSDEDLGKRLKLLSNWNLSPDKRSISRTFQAINFSEGIKLLNAVAKLAVEKDHPPDLHLTECRRVVVEITTPQFQGLTILDMSLAEHIDKMEIQYAETATDINSFQKNFNWELESSPSEDCKVQRPAMSPEQPEFEVQPDISIEHSAGGQAEVDPKDTATLLHSLILVYAGAGFGGLSIQEAASRLKMQGLPGLKDKAKTVQIARITRNHPDFVPCDGIGCYALRKSLLKSFLAGTLDAEALADEKRMEAIVLEKYISQGAPDSEQCKSTSSTPLPEVCSPGLPQSRAPTPKPYKTIIHTHSPGLQRRKTPPICGHRLAA